MHVFNADCSLGAKHLGCILLPKGRNKIISEAIYLIQTQSLKLHHVIISLDFPISLYLL